MTKTTKGALLVILLLITPAFIYADKSDQRQPTENICLEFTGTITGHEKNSKESNFVRLMEEGVILDSLVVSTNQTFHFSLERNKQYSIRISCPGKVDKVVCISTWLFESVGGDVVNKFHFNVNQEAIHKVNKGRKETRSILLAAICYNYEKGIFDYNKKFAALIKKTYRSATK